MESDYVKRASEPVAPPQAVGNLYRYRKPLNFAAGLGIGCLAMCCITVRRGNVS